MMGANTAVGGTKRDAPGGAVGDKQTVERVTGPVESQSMANYGRQRDVVDRESCVIHHCICELRVTNGQPAHLSEKLISRKETGETPQGRYESNHGNSARRFEPRTSQIRKWVSRRRVTAQTAAVKRGCVRGQATPKTSGPLSLHPAREGVVCTAGHLWHSESWSLLPGAARAGALCAALRLPRPEGLRREAGTNVSWLLTRSRSSCVQCTRCGDRSSR
jgi:hypothetical protein